MLSGHNGVPGSWSTIVELFPQPILLALVSSDFPIGLHLSLPCGFHIITFHFTCNLLSMLTLLLYKIMSMLDSTNIK